MLRDFLAGVRVLDLSQYLPGPFATLVLADMGADVLKVEPSAGDRLRGLDPINATAGVDTYYRGVNGGKTVVRLDLKKAADKGTLEKLLAAADVLLESYRPGVLDRLGFGRARLETLNPRLVHCALSGYGQTGPLRLAAGHDLNYMAFAGALAASGTAGQPVMAFPPTADLASGMVAALAILGGLHWRARTGKGVFADTSLAETALYWQAWGLTAAHLGRPPGRAAAVINGGAAYYNLYRTKDGHHVSLGAIEEKFWANFCQAVGRPDLITRQRDPLPQTGLIGEVSAIIAGRTRVEWDQLLGGIDCCYHAVVDYAEVPDLPHVRERGLVRRIDGAQARVEVSFPAWVDGVPPAARPGVAELDVADALRRWGCSF
jgi:crotonobetainyl-CoA:carnitine CoA-transferase CaiB-like acyl-CoA transferase